MSVLKVIQITDLHLSADKSTLLHNINTYKSAQRVINIIASTYKNLNALILTGDLVHDESHDGYEHLNELLQPITCPIFLIPGNHDCLAEIEWLGNKPNFYNDNFMVYSKWVFFMFNTKKDEALEGIFNKQEIFNFEQLLSIYPEKNFLVFTHHHLININSKWMDKMKIENTDEVKNLIKTHSNIKCLSCGHVHQEFSEQLENTSIFTTPSTCYQLKPNSENFTLDDKMGPGYRMFELMDNGEFSTEIIRINKNHLKGT